MHQTINIAKSHPLMQGMKPGMKKEALVVLRCPEEPMTDEDDDSYACEVLKVDGVAMEDSYDGDGDPEEDAEMEMGMGAGDNGQGEPTFTALMFGKKKGGKEAAEVEEE